MYYLNLTFADHGETWGYTSKSLARKVAKSARKLRGAIATIDKAPKYKIIQEFRYLPVSFLKFFA